MRHSTLTLDAAMTVAEALRRLAKHGYWTDTKRPEVRAWLEDYARRIRDFAAARKKPATERSSSEAGRPDPSKITPELAARLFERPADDEAWCTIRRQDGVTLFWYAWPIHRVLDYLADAPPETRLVDALNLHESEAAPAAQESALESTGGAGFEGVVLRGGKPVGIGDGRPFPGFDEPEEAARGGGYGISDDLEDFMPEEEAAGPEDDYEEDSGIDWEDESEAGGAPAPSGGPEPRGRPPRRRVPRREVRRESREEADVEVRAHPHLDAPRTVVAGEVFSLTVGLAERESPAVESSGPIVFSAPSGATVPVEVQVIADGFEAPDGWRKTLAVEVDDPTAARVTFHLVPNPQDESVRLTTLEVHFSVEGVVRGSAARHVIVERSAGEAPPPDERGTSWIEAEAATPNLLLRADPDVPDMEVDIAKPDGNAAKGRYQCVIRNAHGVDVPDAPLDIDLGDDAQTFAKTHIDQIRQWSSDDLVDNLLEGSGDIIASKLPPAFWTTLRAVADRVEDRPVTLQLNSAEPYVPWELALVDPPLDSTRPAYLAAQVVMGRWILGDAEVAAPPRNAVAVKAMAVMAGMYQASSGLRKLPEAIAEAKALAKTYKQVPAVPLNCTPDDLKSLLDAAIDYNFDPIGGVQAVHFAGHGEVDPTRPGEAALYLNNGKPLNPLFFRRSRLGKDHAPFIFLNACMVGTAGEMLGDYGGFPGNCLSGGFTGLIGPLWAVNDKTAKSVALEFYREALTDGRSVAEVLRDLRAHYKSDDPAPSFLAYVYYGNPHLKLTRAKPENGSATIH